MKQRAAGIILAVCTVVSLFAIAKHPTASRTTDIFVELAGKGTIDTIVHSVLLATLCLTFYALLVLAGRRGTDRPSSMLGLIAFGFGTLMTAGAASIDGFLIPGLAANTITHDAATHAIALEVLRVCAIDIQVLTKIGLTAISAAIFAFSFGFLADRRAFAIVGFVLSLVPAAFLTFGEIYLTPTTLGLIFLAHAVWYLWTATLMWREAL